LLCTLDYVYSARHNVTRITQLPQRYENSTARGESPPVEFSISTTERLSPLAKAVANLEGGAMAKHSIEVVPFSGSSYFVDVIAARQLVARGDAKWSGPVCVRRVEDNSKRGEWCKIQSGACGPLVMQLR
jgi:hypothetical protein